MRTRHFSCRLRRRTAPRSFTLHKDRPLYLPLSEPRHRWPGGRTHEWTLHSCHAAENRLCRPRWSRLAGCRPWPQRWSGPPDGRRSRKGKRRYRSNNNFQDPASWPSCRLSLVCGRGMRSEPQKAAPCSRSLCPGSMRLLWMKDKGQVIHRLPGREIGGVRLQGGYACVLHVFHDDDTFRRGHSGNILPEHSDVPAVVHMSMAQEDRPPH